MILLSHTVSKKVDNPQPGICPSRLFSVGIAVTLEKDRSFAVVNCSWHQAQEPETPSFTTLFGHLIIWLWLDSLTP